MPVCAWCGRTIEPGGVRVYIAGARGPFDTFDCAEKDRRRRLAQEHLAALLPAIEAAQREREANREDAVAG